jgi:FlaG/FlaF family flagellin (archaellin)
MDVSPGQIIAVVVFLAGIISTLAGLVYREIKGQLAACQELNKDANIELRKQSETNARLVELSFQERNEASKIRRETRDGT